ncbi:hypothetical protein RE476_10430 [Methanolobus mangrovi]|uniref:Uncharacterized protein n=1 Tax=Methanolobus mangrovi TaxID=3072977 RepID=A0AA51UF36_9EURY|nr:hypothetical protein [Methanolobus mangrovi]WMW21789.1 hypothetical protein RE476_10430 [Methanolobus mangrovi]
MLIIQTPFVFASPVIGIDENISDNIFYSCSYTNPDSVEAHQIVVYSEDGEHTQIHINYKLIPRTTSSPDGNYIVYKKALDAANGVGVEDFVINDTANGTETNIKNIITMGYYPVAFSPDSKMYAAPRIIFFEDCRNGQYAIDICSVHNNTVIHRELTPFYKENTKDTPMDWDRSAIYGVYWSEDGSSIIYEALGADIDGGTYPTYLISKKLNIDYEELRKMNGYDEPELRYTQENIEKTETTSSQSFPVPGFEVIGVVIALALNSKLKRA